MIKLEHNWHMFFAASHAPLAYLRLKSITLPTERTAELSQTLYSFIQTSRGVNIDRIYIE